MEIKRDLGGAVLSLKSENTVGEVVHNEINVPDYDGASIEIGFNIRYWIEALGAQKTGSVHLTFPQAETVGSVLMTLQEFPDFRYVIMPMRL
jgi:DNA polymerase-3 subunit beta